MSYIKQHLKETIDIIDKIDCSTIERMVEILYETRENSGRLFILGVGGSAANSSHAVNDFRKICNIELTKTTF